MRISDAFVNQCAEWFGYRSIFMKIIYSTRMVSFRFSFYASRKLQGYLLCCSTIEKFIEMKKFYILSQSFQCFFVNEKLFNDITFCLNHYFSNKKFYTMKKKTYFHRQKYFLIKSSKCSVSIHKFIKFSFRVFTFKFFIGKINLELKIIQGSKWLNNLWCMVIKRYIFHAPEKCGQEFHT